MLCIDANSVPSSAVTTFFTKGYIDSDHHCFNNNYWKDILLGLKSDINFVSAYPLLETNGCTTLTPTFTNMIDYIYTSNISVENWLTLPLEATFHEVGIKGLPSIDFPSDHIALICNCSLDNRNNK